MTSLDPVVATDEDIAQRGPYGAASDDGHERLASVCFHVSDTRVQALRAQLPADACLKLHHLAQGEGQQDQLRRGGQESRWFTP